MAYKLHDTTHSHSDAPPTIAANMGFEAHAPDTSLTSKARKRKAYGASPAGKAQWARQHHLALQTCLAESIAMKSVLVTMLPVPTHRYVI